MGKKFDLVVTVGEYTGRDGQTKREYKNIGAVMENDKGMYLILDRTFNPAGVPNPENRGNVMVSMFEPRDRQQQGGDRQQSSGAQAGGAPGASLPGRSGDPYDSEIPF